MARPRPLSLATALVALACAPSPAVDESSSREDMSAEVRSFSHSAMGVVFELDVVASPDADLASAAAAAFAEVDRIETRTSSWSRHSELSGWNDDHERPVSAELARLADVALAFALYSGRTFDPSIGAALRRRGFYGEDRPSTTGQLGDSGRVEVGAGRVDPRPQPGFDTERLRGAHVLEGTATLTAPADLELDLSAVAKGYAVERALDILGGAGFDNARLSAGRSSIAARGPGPGDAPGATGWLAVLPFGAEDIELRLLDESLSTSGQTSITLPSGESHILDPRSLEPIEHDTEMVAVRCDSAVLGDMLATALLVVGADEVHAWFDERPELRPHVEVRLWSVGPSMLHLERPDDGAEERAPIRFGPYAQR